MNRKDVVNIHKSEIFIPCTYLKNYTKTATFTIFSDVFALDVEQKQTKIRFLCKPEMTMVGYSFLLGAAVSYFTFSLVITRSSGWLVGILFSFSHAQVSTFPILCVIGFRTFCGVELPDMYKADMKSSVK